MTDECLFALYLAWGASARGVVSAFSVEGAGFEDIVLRVRGLKM